MHETPLPPPPESSSDLSLSLSLLFLLQLLQLLGYCFSCLISDYMMEVTSAPTINSTVPEEEPLPPQQGQVQKKRKFSHNHEKVVVNVKVEGMNHKNEGRGPPSDRWSWRKYGQKPIKGSPYPRGYYRCSTSKGCSAKKQVERCRTDPSVLIITYTANHSHEDPPDLLGNTETSCHYRSTTRRTTTVIDIPSPKQAEVPETETETEMEEKKEKRSDDNNEGEHFRCYLQSSLCGSKENNLLNEEDMETTAYEYDLPENPPTSFLVNGNSKCPSSHNNNNNNSNSKNQLMASSLSAAQKSEENNNNNDDFYDELEELPTSSFFSSFTRRNFVEERILINPSS